MNWVGNDRGIQTNQPSFDVRRGDLAGADPTTGRLMMTRTLWSIVTAAAVMAAVPVPAASSVQASVAAPADRGVDHIDMLAALPELAGWALMVTAMAATGLALRRRRPKFVTA